MSYSHYQVEYILATAQVVTSTGDKLYWSPRYVPHVIRAVGITLTTAPTVTATVLNFTTQPTAHSNTSISAGDIAILNLLTSYVAGNTVYKDGIEKTLTPGQGLVVNVGTASTAGAGDISIFVEPNWETPANNSKMIATT